MKNFKLLGLSAAVLIILGFVAVHVIKSQRNQPTISVTGMAERDFTSDLIVWSASFEVEKYVLSDAYEEISRHTVIVKEYLKKHGFTEANVDFSSIDVRKRTTYRNNTEEFLGYGLTQTFQISTSTDIEKVEILSREITQLIAEGVEITSNAPNYYYTKLDELKLQMLEDASKDAYRRAEVIATGSQAKVKALKTSTMGVFQIIGKNSNEDYSWGGTFNTSSKVKTANITVKATYTVD